MRQVAGISQATLLLLLGACSSEAPPLTGPAADVNAAIDALSKSMESETESVRAAIDRVAKHPQGATMPLVVAELDSSQATRRRAATYVLKMVPWTEPSEAFEPLRKLIAHPEGFTRGMAAMALSAMDDEASYDAILGMLKSDSDAYARRSAAWSIGELGDPRGVEDLKALPSDSDATVQLNVESARERLVFLGLFTDASAPEQAAALAVSDIAGSNENQTARIDQALARLRAVDPEVLRGLLESWRRMSNRPRIQNAATLATQRLQAK